MSGRQFVNSPKPRLTSCRAASVQGGPQLPRSRAPAWACFDCLRRPRSPSHQSPPGSGCPFAPACPSGAKRGRPLRLREIRFSCRECDRKCFPVGYVPARSRKSTRHLADHRPYSTSSSWATHARRSLSIVRPDSGYHVPHVSKSCVEHCIGRSW